MPSGTDSERKIAGPQDSYGYALYHAALSWQRALNAELQPLELTPAQFFLIGSLNWLTRQTGFAPKQKELADHAGLDPMMTSQIVRALEERGLLQRAEDPEDRRARRLGLTREGQELFRKAVSRVQAVDRRFFGVLGDKAGAALKVALDRLAER